MSDRILRTLPDAAIVASAPGRVNLIGEHTDYSGFGVLPMAIDARIEVGLAWRETPVIVVRNAHPNRLPETIPLRDLPERPRLGTWVDYVAAALRVAPPDRGCELFIAGDVPPAVGLSSSSALVVAVLLAVHPPGEPRELAELARHAEHYVGTRSGGMDQAIALLARAGHALAIDFAPLRAEAIALPEDLGVVVANSGIVAAKGGAVQAAYNDRVEACSRAARELAGVTTLGEVPPPLRIPSALRDPLLARRAGFVFAEAQRRDLAVAALRTGDLDQLGRLIDASHAGLRDDFEVSHPAVDALVDELRAAGALGARIVGAGFGGCAIGVCRRDAVPAVLARLGERGRQYEAAGPAERHELA